MPASSRNSHSTSSKTPVIPRPSASILLFSPTNEILLLHRVKTSTSFASAHVFPGGNLSPSQDGPIPNIKDPLRHKDCSVYRRAAIRECFEECGLLLVKPKDGLERGQETLDAEVEKQREEARRDVHDNKVKFGRWVDSIGGILDEEGLVPFTRWITPAGLPRRFTTQMYLYFLPVRVGGKVDEVKVPTSDGGIEHTTAEFRSPEAWLKLARKGEVELYPPQFLLLSLVAKFLQSSGDGVSIKELKKQREDLLEFVRKGNWGERCVSPRAVHRPGGKKMVFVFDFSGKEVKNEGRTGIDEFVMRVEMKKEGGVRALEVLRREDVFGSKGKI